MGDSHVIHGTLGILLPLARMLWRGLFKEEAFVLGPQVPSMGIERWGRGRILRQTRTKVLWCTELYLSGQKNHCSWSLMFVDGWVSDHLDWVLEGLLKGLSWQREEEEDHVGAGARIVHVVRGDGNACQISWEQVTPTETGVSWVGAHGTSRSGG